MLGESSVNETATPPLDFVVAGRAGADDHDQVSIGAELSEPSKVKPAKTGIFWSLLIAAGILHRGSKPALHLEPAAYTERPSRTCQLEASRVTLRFPSSTHFATYRRGTDLQIHFRKLPVLLSRFSGSHRLCRRHPHLGTIQVRRTEQGNRKGVAIRSNGGLELAPAFKTLYTTPSTYIWAIASDDAGNIYAAAGSPARVYRITPDGKATHDLRAARIAGAGTGGRQERRRLRRHHSGRQGLQNRAQAHGKADACESESVRQVQGHGRSELEFLRLFRSRHQVHLGSGARQFRQSLRRHRRSRRNLSGDAERRSLGILQERRSPHPRAGDRSQRKPDRRLRWQRPGVPDFARRAKRSFCTALPKKKSPRWLSTRRETSTLQVSGEKRPGRIRRRASAATANSEHRFARGVPWPCGRHRAYAHPVSWCTDDELPGSRRRVQPAVRKFTALRLTARRLASGLRAKTSSTRWRLIRRDGC